MKALNRLLSPAVRGASPASTSRIYWIDAAKALGIFLVFYGHFLQKLFRRGNETGFLHTKFIYAFHMPFFFFLAGFFFQRRDDSFWQATKVLVRKRMRPVLLFGVISLFVWPVYLQVAQGAIDWGLIAARARAYLIGQPDLNEVTWFLVGLFTTELFALFFLSHVQRGMPALIVAVIFLRFGLVMTGNMKATVVSLGVQKNFWYFHEAFVAFGLYALGYALYPHIKKLLNVHPLGRVFLFILFSALTLFTFDANQSHKEFFVIMQQSWHGDPGWFVFTALSGIFALLLLSSLIPYHRYIEYVGKNTLIMIGTNGLFLHFVYSYLAGLLNLSESAGYVIGISAVVTVASIALSVPLIWCLNKYLPQWVGK